MALAGPLARRAAAAPDATAVVSDGLTLTRAGLDALVRRRAARLAEAGPVAGRRVLLLRRSPVDALVGLAACDRLAGTAVVGDPRWAGPVREALVRAVEPDLVETDDGDEAYGTGAPDDEGAPVPAIAGGPGTAWLATCTSGSTAAPRAVLRTRASWSSSYAAFTALTGAGPGRTVLVPGPLPGSLFLYGAVHALVAAGPLLLEPVTTDRPWDVAHLVPAQLAALLDTDADLRGRTAVVAGAAVPAPLLRTALDRGVEVLSYYGATELSFVAAGHAGAPLRPFPWVEVEARDGLLWVRSPYLALGYLGGGPGPWRSDGRGWATVGDTGAVDTSGGVVVGGRGDEAVTTGAATVAVEDVESVLLTLPGVVEAVVVGTPHPRLGEVVTAVLVPRAGADAAAWPAAARALLAPTHRPRRWYVAPALPRTATGKPARAEVRRGLAEGSLGARRLP